MFEPCITLVLKLWNSDHLLILSQNPNHKPHCIETYCGRSWPVFLNCMHCRVHINKKLFSSTLTLCDDVYWKAPHLCCFECEFSAPSYISVFGGFSIFFLGMRTEFAQGTDFHRGEIHTTNKPPSFVRLSALSAQAVVYFTCPSTSRSKLGIIIKFRFKLNSLKKYAIISCTK